METKDINNSRYNPIILRSGFRKKYSTFGNNGITRSSSSGTIIIRSSSNEFHKTYDPYPFIEVVAPSNELIY